MYSYTYIPSFWHYIWELTWQWIKYYPLFWTFFNAVCKQSHMFERFWAMDDNTYKPMKGCYSLPPALPVLVLRFRLLGWSSRSSRLMVCRWRRVETSRPEGCPKLPTKSRHLDFFFEFYDILIDFQGRVEVPVNRGFRLFDFLLFNTRHHLRAVCCIHFYQSTQAKELLDELHWQSWFKALECFITRCHMIISYYFNIPNLSIASLNKSKVH